MKIGVFTYAFENIRGQDGLLRLMAEGYVPECIIAEPYVKLNFYQSKIRITPKGVKYIHPKKLAEIFDIPYFQMPHNSKECQDLIKEYDLDVGVMLGSRIFKEPTINAFNIGILNMHAGLLPENRGLDNHKWAILYDIPQGVTAHLIDKDIDKGNIVVRRVVNVYKDDTLLDIYLRVWDTAYDLMIESLDIFKNGKRNFEPVSQGEYRSSVPPDLENNLMECFEAYKQKRGI